jgi:uncharacterized protein
MPAIIIPYDQLSAQALQGVVMEFITRESTDYGKTPIPLETKISQVYGNLKSGRAVIVFDEETATCNIFHKNDPVLKDLKK